jgi:hypothetical protein
MSTLCLIEQDASPTVEKKLQDIPNSNGTNKSRKHKRKTTAIATSLAKFHQFCVLMCFVDFPWQQDTSAILHQNRMQNTCIIASLFMSKYNYNASQADTHV